MHHTFGFKAAFSLYATKYNQASSKLHMLTLEIRASFYRFFAKAY